jgi:FMN-dependent oxidoreductase (nitrilotriacetate monooxygenase family)
MTRELTLGLILTGAGGNVNSWRDERVPSDAAANFEFQKAIVQRAEQALFDFVFVAYSDYVGPTSPPFFVSRFDPIVQLSALAAVTSRIGLVGTVSTTFNDPYNAARQLGSLDVLSHGRAGWNVVTSALEDAAKNYGGERILPHAQRYARAGEFVDAVTALWNTLPASAFVRDKVRNVYVDPEQFRRTDFHGEHFSVLGPLNIEPSEQGSPVVFQAGASADGIALGGRVAEAIFSTQLDDEALARFNTDLTAAAEAAGRRREDIRVLPLISPIIGDTVEEAFAKRDRASRLIDERTALNYLSRFYSFHDLSQYDLDAPPPAHLVELAKDSFASTAQRFADIAERDGLSLRELAYRVISPDELLIGTAEQIADALQSRFERGLVDGYIVSGHIEPESLNDFTTRVVPILQERGLFRTAYSATTLRGHLFPERTTEASR